MPGKVVNGNGYQTKSFKPAYVKDKRRFDANIPFKRMAGETIGGNLSNAQRYERALATTLQDQLDNLTRREEVMAAEILRTGKTIVSGDGYPATTVDFGRDAALTKALVSENTWSGAGSKPLDNLEDWAAEIQNKAGVVAKTVVMDPDAWKIFRSNASVENIWTIAAAQQTVLTRIQSYAAKRAKLVMSVQSEILTFGCIMTAISMILAL